MQKNLLWTEDRSDCAYRKINTYLDTQKTAVISLKFEKLSFTIEKYVQKL